MIGVIMAAPAAPTIAQYAPCPKCEWPRAAWWTDGWIDCEDCGIFSLSDGDRQLLEKGSG